MRLLAIILLPAFCIAAPAVEKPITAGEHGCKVFPVEKMIGRPVWSGPCKDGLADGQGGLKWTKSGKPSGEFKGVMKEGRFHGVGYTMTPDNAQYEGEFVAGQREGFGIALNTVGDRYDGNWKAGLPEGHGKMVYALGGDYEGGWLAGKYHGKGTITYAGGRRAEYEFSNGRWSDDMLGTETHEQYNLRRNAGLPSAGGFLDLAVEGLPVPPELSYEKLSAEQKRAVAAMYPLMDPADEPPYFLNGPRAAFLTIANMRTPAEGEMTILVSVGANGEAQSVTTIGSPSPNLVKLATYVYMLEKYKPGKCAGKPCAMVLPMKFKFLER